MMQGIGLPFYYLIAGEMEVEVEGGRQLLRPGDIAIFPGWPKHILHLDGGDDHPRSIMDFVTERDLPVWSPEEGLNVPLSIRIGQPPFSTSFLSGNFFVDQEEAAFLNSSLPRFICLALKDGSTRASAKALLDMVLIELNHTKPGFAATAARGLELLVVQALRTWLLEAEQAPLWVRGIQSPPIRRTLQAIHADPGRAWSLPELAEIAGQSRSTFAGAFRQTMGETPFAHLRRLRIHIAATRLRSGRKSVAAIAAELGYSDRHALGRAFQQEMGLSAAAYRRMHKDKKDH